MRNFQNNGIQFPGRRNVAWQRQGMQLLHPRHWGRGLPMRYYFSRFTSATWETCNGNKLLFLQVLPKEVEILPLQVCQCKAGVEVCSECIPVMIETVMGEPEGCGCWRKNYFVIMPFFIHDIIKISFTSINSFFGSFYLIALFPINFYIKIIWPYMFILTWSN